MTIQTPDGDVDRRTPIAQDLDGVRTQPSVRIAVFVFIGYLATIVITNLIFARDVDFSEVTASAENTRNGVVIPVACAAAYLTIVASVLGWWPPALFEPRRRVHLPLWLWSIPILAIVGFAGDIARSEHRGDFTTEHWWYLIIGFILVGYSEELMTRGLLLTGMRAEWLERRALIGTTLLFALMHGLNFAFGQDLSTTIKQMAGVIPMALLFYVVRRVTGTLIFSMLVHGMLDFSIIVFGGTSAAMNNLDSDAGAPVGAGLPLILAIVALFVHRKRFFSGNANAPDIQ
jgi:hypothetical protein